MLYTLHFLPLQNAVCFIILTYLVPVLFTFYIQGVLKLKKIIIILAPKVNIYRSLHMGVPLKKIYSLLALVGEDMSFSSYKPEFSCVKFSKTRKF
jgi:hypothetical protein